MTARQQKLLREAIDLITRDNMTPNEYENGMLILYRLAGMRNAIEQIQKLRKAPTISLFELLNKKD